MHKTAVNKNKTKLTLSLKSKNTNGEKTKSRSPPSDRPMDITTKFRSDEENRPTETKRSDIDPSKFQPGKSFIEKTLFSWNVTATTASQDPLFNDRDKSSNFSKSSSEPSCSTQSAFRMNAFSKNSFFNKSKKLTLRRIGGNGDSSVKAEKLKKKKRIVKKHK